MTLGNALTARAAITDAEITTTLQNYGYRRGTYVAEMGWEYDRETCIQMAATQVLGQARIPSGPLAPADFTALVSSIASVANQLLLRTEEVGQVLQ